MDNFYSKKVYMLGIKGVGMTALAEILLNLGAEITGSDTEEEFHTDAVLKGLGIKTLTFSEANISKKIDLLIYSSAYGLEHPERKKALKLGITQLSYAKALSSIFNKKRSVMVAGSHGKTTTTALLGHILAAAGFDPTVVVGGTVVAWNSNVRIGNLRAKTAWMIAEGDEYQQKFLEFNPDYLLITNIDYDHPDFFPDKRSYKDVFRKLAAKTKKKVFTQKNAKNFRRPLDTLSSPYLLGEHNKKNLRLILTLCQELGISEAKIKKGIAEFRGVRRRMEIYVESKNFTVIDDYAHHPVEISATLKAVKEKWPERKITVIFQPHTFSRTRVMLKEFAAALKDADEIYLAPIYSSARENLGEQEGLDDLLYSEVCRSVKRCSRGLPSLDDLFKKRESRIYITMGAGDIWHFAKSLAQNKYRFPRI